MKRWILIAWLLTIGVAIAGIAGKELLLARGNVVYLRLAPVDPRSLMQGDYMALNFAIANDINAVHARQSSDLAREETVVIRRAGSGEATFARLHRGEPLAEGEQLLRVQNVISRWGGMIPQVSTDAYFFEEGQAKRFEAARYGEFRVDAKGQALLVGLADETLRSL